MKIKKFAAALCAMAMTTAMFTACGDSDSSSKSEASSKKAETTTTTTAAEVSAVASEADTSAAAAPADGEPYYDEVTGLECQTPSGDYTPVTEFKGYDAFLMFADYNWMWSNFAGQGYPEENRADGAYGVDADITGDGEYTVAINVDSIAANDAVLNSPNPQIILDGDYVLPAQGAVVFCIDITGICDGTTNFEGEALEKNQLTDGENPGIDKNVKGKYTGQDVKVELTSIKIDGEEFPFDASKIVYGNIEDANNCYRIEIYNDYGLTCEDPGIDTDALMFAKSLECTFTIEGLTKEG